jgi:REP element-mobilizing transposase RayT
MKTENAWVGIDAKTRFLGLELPGLRCQAGGRRRVRGMAGQANAYHVMSRMTDGLAMWDDVEKEALARLLWKMAAFCGLEVLTYCVMGNHFHALVRVPDKEQWLERFAGGAGEERFFEHLGSLYSKGYVTALRAEVARLRADGKVEEAELVLAAYRRRFCEVSVWTKEVKERFSKWLNKRRERRGTLWMERFKSVLVQDGVALRTMANYIDLNPVRAGLVADPAEYRWSGYGEACGGSARARAGLCGVLGVAAEEWDKAKVGENYRVWLYEQGVETRGEDGAMERRGVSMQAAEGVRKARGRLPVWQALRLRWRHMSQGMALGSREWVEEVFAAHRENFGKKRENGARAVRGLDSGLFTLRDLR